MLGLSTKKLARTRGIIVWDFDRVLFDTERFYRAAKMIFKKYGVPPAILWKVILQIRKKDGPFSTARVLRILGEKGYRISERKVRKDIHNHLLKTPYFDSSADELLHRLQRRGFLHIILSQGAASYTHKRVKVGCGEKFTRHFIKIYAVRRPKFFLVKKLKRHYPDLSFFFVDDTKEHIELMKKYVPGVRTIHYTKEWSLKKVERSVIRQNV